MLADLDHPGRADVFHLVAGIFRDLFKVISIFHGCELSAVVDALGYFFDAATLAVARHPAVPLPGFMAIGIDVVA
ncbi:hypothetical protein [Streptomyces sp. NPDC056191]|uniref:hypothetical protein n=1 Tax=Streptomyces sp. NPDC056191 TaxID=3345742 RepID=UPI0035D7C80A